MCIFRLGIEYDHNHIAHSVGFCLVSESMERRMFFATRQLADNTEADRLSTCWPLLQSYVYCLQPLINTLRPRQNGRHFADDIFKRIFLNENVRIWIKISLKFVHKGPINNIPALVQMNGAKPLSESMMVSLLAHICVTRPQWVKPFWW